MYQVRGIVAAEMTNTVRKTVIPVSTQTWIFWSIVGIVFPAIVLLTATQDTRDLIYPASCMYVAAALFVGFLILKKREALGVFELGIFYGLIVTLYGIYPLLAFLIRGKTTSETNDLRLYLAQPTVEEMGEIGWYYAAYLFAFMTGYLLLRRNSSPGFNGTVLSGNTGVPELAEHDSSPGDKPSGRFLDSHRLFGDSEKNSRVIICTVVFLVCLVKVYQLFLSFYFHIQEAQTYGESYLVYSSLPLWLRQVTNHLNLGAITLEILLILVLTSNYARTRLLLFAWLGFEVVMIFVNLGSRAQTMMLILAFIISYHCYVRPIRLSRMALLGAALFIVFSLQGLFRGYDDISLSQALTGYAHRGSEFEALFSNTFDILTRQRVGGELTDFTPSELYLSEFLRFVPQQFLSFEKIDLPVWYVNTFYPEYAKGGGGLAFGAIAESVIGQGWPELILRALLVGVSFALAHNYCTRGRKSIWAATFYIWIVVMSYNAFRNTTFSLFGLFLYDFLLPVVAVKSIAGILTFRRRA